MNFTNLNMVRGNTYSFDILVTNTGTGAVENLTNGTLSFTAKWLETDADLAAVFQLAIGSGITLITAAAGTANVTIPESATDIAAIPYNTVNLYYDLKYTSSAAEVFTVLWGNLNITPNITRS